MPSKVEYNRIARRISELESRLPKPMSPEGCPEMPHWFWTNFGTARAIMETLPDRVMAASGLPPSPRNRDGIPTALSWKAAFELNALLIRWRGCATLEEAQTIAKEMMDRYPPVETNPSTDEPSE
jgi:hypothetical protein